MSLHLYLSASSSGQNSSFSSFSTGYSPLSASGCSALFTLAVRSSKEFQENFVIHFTTEGENCDIYFSLKRMPVISAGCGDLLIIGSVHNTGQEPVINQVICLKYRI